MDMRDRSKMSEEDIKKSVRTKISGFGDNLSANLNEFMLVAMLAGILSDKEESQEEKFRILFALEAVQNSLRKFDKDIGQLLADLRNKEKKNGSGADKRTNDNNSTERAGESKC